MVDTKTEAFRESRMGENWIEIYHSRHSWDKTLIEFRKDNEPWIPFGKYMLIDAKNVRPGFRAFRINASRLEFRLSNLGRTVVEPPKGEFTIARPGRYVVMDSSLVLRRVGEADVIECLRALRPRDRYLEIYYRADPRWRKVFITYSLAVLDKWVSTPMLMSAAEGDLWFHRIEILTHVEFVFSDGGDEWDNHDGKNYGVYLPGKYGIANNRIIYLGASNADRHSK